jgi:hypothetical protein
MVSSPTLTRTLWTSQGIPIFTITFPDSHYVLLRLQYSTINRLPAFNHPPIGTHTTHEKQFNPPKFLNLIIPPQKIRLFTHSDVVRLSRDGCVSIPISAIVPVGFSPITQLVPVSARV